ncbi:MAG: DUF4440 domain-containing protein [Phycisphaerae bacterium]
MFVSVCGCSASALGIADSPRATLERQADAWNRGDIDAFMDGYWKSPDLTFSSGGQTRRGWQATLERYRQRYPTRDRMGHLTFSDLEQRSIGDRAALVLGRWRLDRANESNGRSEQLGGNFSLLFEKIRGHWLITHDHTSSDSPP